MRLWSASRGSTPLPHDWPPEAARQQRERFQRALRPACGGICAPSGHRRRARGAPPRRHPRLRRGRAHPSDRRAVDGAGAAHVPHHQRLVVDGLRHSRRHRRAGSPGPERPVVALVGDGCFQMTCGEVAVAQRLGLPCPSSCWTTPGCRSSRSSSTGGSFAIYGTDWGRAGPPRASRPLLRRPRAVREHVRRS